MPFPRDRFVAMLKTFLVYRFRCTDLALARKLARMSDERFQELHEQVQQEKRRRAG